MWKIGLVRIKNKRNDNEDDELTIVVHKEQLNRHELHIFRTNQTSVDIMWQTAYILKNKKYDVLPKSLGNLNSSARELDASPAASREQYAS